MARNDFITDNAKKMADNLYNVGRNVWLVGLGAVAVAEEESRGMFDRLVARGETFEKSEKNLVSKYFDKATGTAKDVGKTVGERVQGTVSGVLRRTGVPSRDEIRTLIDRVEELTQKVDALAEAR